MHQHTDIAEQPEFEDDFDAATLDRHRWWPHHVPHWSSRATSAASYRLDRSILTLYLAPDQPPWCPEFDGDVRVSALQTGQHAGPRGSVEGQLKFAEDVVVREEQPQQRLYTPTRGRIEMRARARMNRNSLVSLYLIGFADPPEDSGEITVMEIFGTHVESDGVTLGRGIKALTDPRLRDEFEQTKLALDVAGWHDYAIDWTHTGVSVLLDGEQITRTTQSPAYPMQLMLTYYELPDDKLPAPLDHAIGAAHTTEAGLDVDHVRGFAATSRPQRS